MENLIEELTKVNPFNLSEEGLKLFNTINEIIDRNKVLEEENKDLQDSVDQIYDDYQDIGKMYFNLTEKIERLITQIENAIDFMKTDKSKIKVDKNGQREEDLRREIKHLKELLEEE